MAARTWYYIWKCTQLFVPSKHLTAKGKVFLGWSILVPAKGGEAATVTCIDESTSTTECHQLVLEWTVISSLMRYHCVQPYKTSQSLSMQDISVSSHMRYLHLEPSATYPSPAIQDMSGWDQYMQYSPSCYTPWSKKQNKSRNKVNPIAAFLKPCES